MATKCVADLAGELNDKLVHDTRADGVRFVKLADDAPEWMEQACRKAHGDMMPDDWRYDFIEDCAQALMEDDAEDAPDAGDMYPYNADRCRWLASNLNRGGYCDTAMEEFGGDVGGIFNVLGLGMQEEMREVFDLLKSQLEEWADSAEDEGDDAE